MKLEHTAVIGSELALAFDDGIEAYIPLLLLRRACPCAQCQGEPDALGRVVVPASTIGDRGCEVTGMETVGGYGLQIRWADGHSTGIYSYPLLRQLAAAAEN